MKQRLFPFIIALSALTISGSAAFYSVIGLSKLFAGASTQVIIMASSLEFSKLVIASALYQYWSSLNKLIKTYLFTALFILILITSGGIYGYLSGAYQTTSKQSDLMQKELSLLTTKQDRFKTRLSDLQKNIQIYTEGLSKPGVIQYVDSRTGQLITTTSSSQRKVLENQLNSALLKQEVLEDSVAKYDMLIIEKESTNSSARELGPLEYMSKLFNKPMDKIVNWFMLLIIFVFDPLAIILVVIANQAFSNLKKVFKENKETIQEIETIDKKELSEEDSNKNLEISSIKEPNTESKKEKVLRRGNGYW